MKFVKTIIFLVAWVLSFTCGIYLMSVVFYGNVVSNFDLLMNGCGFLLAMLWMWFNTVKA